MHNQPRYKPLAASNFFGDGRSARPVIEGTVPRGHVRIDEARFTGKMNGTDVEAFPFPITRADLKRGQLRFNIYCSPCHGRLGDGQGLVVKRGFYPPPSYHTDRLLQAPVGHFFDVMTNGFGAMASYASRVPVDDRWRIAAYIRVLQFSENVKLSDVPPDVRAKLEAAPGQTIVGNEAPETQELNSRPPVPAPARRGTDK